MPQRLFDPVISPSAQLHIWLANGDVDLALVYQNIEKLLDLRSAPVARGCADRRTCCVDSNRNGTIEMNPSSLQLPSPALYRKRRTIRRCRERLIRDLGKTYRIADVDQRQSADLQVREARMGDEPIYMALQAAA